MRMARSKLYYGGTVRHDTDSRGNPKHVFANTNNPNHPNLEVPSKLQDLLTKQVNDALSIGATMKSRNRCVDAPIVHQPIALLVQKHVRKHIA